jgi:hypothetical protein
MFSQFGMALSLLGLLKGYHVRVRIVMRVKFVHGVRLFCRNDYCKITAEKGIWRLNGPE